MAELIEMLFGLRTRVGPGNHVLDGGTRAAREEVLLRRMTSGFSCSPPNTVPSVPNIGISPHAVDQHSRWPAAVAVECHIKLSQ